MVSKMYFEINHLVHCGMNLYLVNCEAVFKLKQSRQCATAEQLFSRCIDLTVDSFFALPLLFGVICHRAIQ